MGASFLANALLFVSCTWMAIILISCSSNTMHKALVLLATLLVALPIIDAKSKRAHADTTITNKVFFDVEIDGHKAGGLYNRGMWC